MLNIDYNRLKLIITNYIKESQENLWLATAVFLLVILSFGLGKLSNLQQNLGVIYDKEIEGLEHLGNGIYLRQYNDNPDISAIASQNSINKEIEEIHPGPPFPKEGEETPQNQILVGSKNSNKFHLENCSGAKRIGDKNKIVFKDIEDALQKGYVPAENCPELQKLLVE